ncbi:signal recognition particle-docking protein FtsY [Candidatus Woesearchaeota archaeon]|jgi:fused signal recognition particle receptor|nr:signal recognition particle-docking protein FtsY [Candidatus Woesearchaeota archaeon]MBT4368752.1 signal recognition particle-docking protein FtsY [Candidatus Woesearchaeota archaeon]MBT4712041.1 signal recognition particle-docking protein FtsY [Candidatus Woesearchaeota archaeon]MBT6639211.1 signal recognition particle-docking protein FtsY [Candidatus Woesearchaeota archaeon]MBT7134411.1 signal recognition particle-docking protein FtsY [Candidatus Woesearchaeota archaeon]
MFKFLKNKLKNAVDKFSKKVEEEAEDVEEIETPKEEKVVEKKQKKIKEKEKKVEKKQETVVEKETKKEEIEPAVEEEKKDSEPRDKPKKKGFFHKITSKKISEKKFEDLFWDLEVMLLENNVATEVIEKIKEDLKENIVDKPIKKVSETIQTSLRESIKEVLNVENIDLEKKLEKTPLVICFLGINGSGKTTTIAKFAKMMLDKKKTVVLAAADTFRAAAIDQLQEHADKLGVKMIKHDYGSDPAAVAFDAIKHAEAKGIDVVLIDTAGRLHSNANLVDEMKKIIRVANPDLKIFVGESITGNDCVEQATKFNEAVEIDGIILSKADIDEKGGAAISVSYVTGKPIMYLGMGQEYKDIEEFNSEKVLKTLGL